MEGFFLRFIGIYYSKAYSLKLLKNSYKSIKKENYLALYGR